MQDSWKGFIAARAAAGDDVDAFFGPDPQFEREEDRLPLQAADFWAWWVRRGYETGTLSNLKKDDFGIWQGAKHIHGTMMEQDEDQLAFHLMKTVRLRLDCLGLQAVPVYDAKYDPKPKTERVESPSERIFGSLRRWLQNL